MADLVFWVVLLLLVGGVITSIVPVVPGSLLSLVGLIIFALFGTMSDLGFLWLLLLLLFVLVALVFDGLASIVSSRMGGASTKTAILGVVVGIVLTFVLGPLGLIVGLAGTVFVIQYHKTEDIDESARAALYATVGIVASKVIQVVLNLIVLVVFLWRVGLPAI